VDALGRLAAHPMAREILPDERVAAIAARLQHELGQNRAAQTSRILAQIRVFAVVDTDLGLLNTCRAGPPGGRERARADRIGSGGAKWQDLGHNTDDTSPPNALWDVRSSPKR
jgi:hypothetical protein